MTKQKSTKRALLLSALSVLVCLAMLVGSTFAWFTDSVTSSGNIIKSGTLDVTMHWANGTEAPENATWNDASNGAIFNYDLWEPGYAEVRHIKIENKGSLALKYQISITANGEISKLSDVIDVYYVDPAVQVTDRAALNDANKLGTLTEVLANISATASGDLKVGEKHTVTLALKMQEDAGNEYQNLSIGSDFSVQLMATQLDFESDSFGNLYDDDADRSSNVAIKTANDMQSAFDDAKDGDVLTLTEEIIPEETLVFDNDAEITLDLGGKTIESSLQTLIAVNSGKVTIKNGTIKNSAGVGLFNSRSEEYRDAIHLSGDAVVEIKDVVIETVGNAIVLEDNARITELNANVTAYCDRPTYFESNAILLRSGNARIDLISGGEYISTYTQEVMSNYGTYNPFRYIPSYALHINSDTASVGQISGGTFLGMTNDGRNGATVLVNSGKIEKISGGYFGFCKNTFRNSPYGLISVKNDASIDAITGGTFEYAGYFDCKFDEIVAASGCAVEKTTETLTVSYRLSSGKIKEQKVTLYNVISQ